MEPERQPYHLRPAIEADREWAYLLNRRCFREVIERQFGPWKEELAREHFDGKWRPADYQVIVCDRHDVGIVRTEWKIDCLYLAEIEIDPAFQNRGFGTQVVAELLEDARQKGLPLRLQVLLENRAKHFYFRLGFSQTGVTDTHVLMEKRL